VDLAAFGRRYGVDVWAVYGNALQRFVDEHLVLRDGARLRLTRQGMLIANEILQVFV
jgi:coproporphyrinogen III oxidase-like Fe-S oxidoreductase